MAEERPSALKTLRWYLDGERDALRFDEGLVTEHRSELREIRERIVGRSAYIADLEAAIGLLEARQER